MADPDKFYSQDNLVFTRDVKIAAALVALGCRMPERAIEQIQNGTTEPYCLFYFYNEGMTSMYVKAWNAPSDSYKDPDSDDKSLCNPDHPLWYMRAHSRNRERLVMSIKRAVKTFLVKRNGKTYVMTKNSNSL